MTTLTPPAFGVEVRGTDLSITLALGGALDLDSANTLRDYINAAVDCASGDLILDMTALTFLDMNGVSVMIEAHRRLVDDGRGLRLVNVGPQPHAMLELSGVNDALDGIPTLPPNDVRRSGARACVPVPESGRPTSQQSKTPTTRAQLDAAAATHIETSSTT